MELADLALAQEQLALATGLMVHPVAVAVFGDMTVDQPHLFFVQGRIAFGDRALALAKRLDLGSGENDPRLELILNEIIVTRAPVFGNDLALVERLGVRLGHGWARLGDYPRLLQGKS
jgi:hypothetical protein